MVARYPWPRSPHCSSASSKLRKDPVLRCAFSMMLIPNSEKCSNSHPPDWQPPEIVNILPVHILCSLKLYILPSYS